MPGTMIANLNGEAVSIERSDPGGYDAEGVFTPGAVNITAAVMSVQPMTGRELEALPEGRRQSGFMKGYIATETETLAEASITPEDKIVWRGRRYEVHAAEPWYGGQNTLTHWKVFMVEEAE